MMLTLTWPNSEDLVHRRRRESGAKVKTTTKKWKRVEETIE